jgi:hypothetical protein
MYKYKNKNIVGQRANTRCQNIIDTVRDKANASATKYCTARAALVKLSIHCVDNDGWRDRLLPLNQKDIQPLMEGEEGESEGNRTLSWIWKVVGVGSNSDDLGLQVGEQYGILILALQSDPSATVSATYRVVQKPCPSNVLVRAGVDFTRRNAQSPSIF